MNQEILDRIALLLGRAMIQVETVTAQRDAVATQLENVGVENTALRTQLEKAAPSEEGEVPA